ncbi:MAG: D-alanine--D-alanine ligase [Phycisphaerales bacterium]
MNAAPTAAVDANAPAGAPKRVLVLGGGPDAEREVSIKSATGIAEALRAAGRYDVERRIIDTITVDQLRAIPADVLFPYLHGPWGEGGPLQDILEADGRPYVGTNARGSRAAMDKIAAKCVALELGIPTPPVWILCTRDPVCPAPLPVIIKPVHEGSTVGLYVCTSRRQFADAVEAIRAEQAAALAVGRPVRTYMIEPKIGGDRPARELTVGVIDAQALPIIEIRPKDGLYDYEAKYTRDDTVYLVGEQIPDLPEALARKLAKQTCRLFKALGLRHIARADFMLDAGPGAPTAWFLEINTTPGFTDHSLVPKAARHAGTDMPALCSRLVEIALRDHSIAPAP